MKLEIDRTEKANKVDIGDVLVGSDGGLYYVTFSKREAFPVRLIDLETHEDVNGFKTRRSINRINNNCSIVRVIKGKNLLLKEISE